VRGEFRRSAVFGLVGVFVVAGIAIAIALSADSSDSNPKLQMGLIFGVIAVFFVGLFIFQRRDLNRAASGDVRGFSKGSQEIDDPTKLGDGELWAALAVNPIGDDAIKARREVWGAARRSMNLGVVITVLIFLSVPPVYLLDTFIPLFIGGALIGILALYGVYRAIGPGGEVESGFDRLGVAMKPLGLSLTDRPSVRMVPRAPTMPGYSATLVGPTAMVGERHDRKVEVHQEAGQSEVTVSVKSPKFEAQAKRGRFAADDGASNAAAILSGLPHSDRWNGVKIHAGPTGIMVDRKGDPSAWLCDLWLAERIAEGI
jgi:uncharacterized membrane protein YedE/YeeE